MTEIHAPDAAASDAVPQSSPAAAPSAPGARQPSSQPARRGGGTAALALVLALVAAAGAGYGLWQQWQQQRASVADSANLSSLQQRVAVLQAGLATLRDERSTLQQRVDDASQGNRALRESLLTQTEHTRRLEDAVARLGEKTLSGRDPMLLDQTESLLRMGAERYRLFNDAQGALDAFTLAAQTLASVNDDAFSGVRQAISDEREALQKSRPIAQAGALAQLQGLRASVAELPLKPAAQAVAPAPTGVWQRIAHALAGVISVRRDDGAPLAMVDARFVRELTALDLAQAQVALMAFDRDGYATAMARVDANLAAQFDGADARVRDARARVEQLRSALPPAVSVELGAALTELRNLRSVHALAPAGAADHVIPDTAAGTPGAQP